jgi:hypothetical protein
VLDNIAPNLREIAVIDNNAVNTWKEGWLACEIAERSLSAA